MTRLWILGCVIALVPACQEAEPIAQTIVYVDAEPRARTAVAQIKVQAIGPGDHREPSVETKDPDWPIKLVFAPKNADASRRFALNIEARDASDTRLATLRLRTGFVANQTRYVILMIHDRCAERPAGGCEDGACHQWSRELTAKELGSSSKKPRTLDVTCEPGMDGEPPPDMGPDEPGSMDGGITAQAGSGTATSGTGANAGAGGAAGATVPTRPVDGPMGSCEEGWVRANGVCMDIDECANGTPCGARGDCMNTPGGFACECEPGYMRSGDGCTDVDECQNDQDGCEAGCADLDGSFECSCAEGDWLRADRKACGNFAPAERLALTTSTEAMQPRFAFDAEGNGLAIWLQSDGMRTYLWTRRYVAGEGWSGRASRVPTGEAGNASSPRVALDPGGRGVIAWLQSVDTRNDLWAARYAGGLLEASTLIETEDAGSAYDPSVALDEAGNGLAVWSQSDGTHARIRVSRFDAEDGWATAFPIQSSMTDEAGTPRLALDRAGNATVGWSQYFVSDTEGARVSPWTARFDATLGRWRLPTLVDDSTFAGVPDTQLFEPAGHAVTVWSRATEMRVSVWARARTAEGDRSEPVRIGPDSGLAPIIPRIALSPAGNGAAVWVQGSVGAFEVWANRYDGANDRWAEAEALSQSSATPTAPAIAVDPSGDGFAVWSEIAGTARVVRAARLQHGAGFVGAIELAADTTADPPANSPAYIAVDRQGAAMAIWDVLREGKYEVWARKFE